MFSNVNLPGIGCPTTYRLYETARYTFVGEGSCASQTERVAADIGIREIMRV
jgi:hypothetical protein